MEHETPRHNAKPTLNAILDDLDRTGFKLTGMLKRLVLAGEETGCLRFRDQGDPFYDATCVFCGTAYEERLGGMLLACTACTPVVTRVFPTTGDWTQDGFRHPLSCDCRGGAYGATSRRRDAVMSLLRPGNESLDRHPVCGSQLLSYLYGCPPGVERTRVSSPVGGA